MINRQLSLYCLIIICFSSNIQSSIVQSFIRKYREDKAKDNLIFSYGKARDFNLALIELKKFNEEKSVKIRDGIILDSANVFQLFRHFFFIDPAQVKNIEPENLQCVTLKNLGLESFDRVKRILNILKIKPASVGILDLGDNKLEEITAEDLNQFCNLQALFLANNQITKFPVNAIENTNIALLDVEGNKLTEFSQLAAEIMIKCVKQLVSINFAGNSGEDEYEMLHALFASYEVIKGCCRVEFRDPNTPDSFNGKLALWSWQDGSHFAIVKRIISRHCDDSALAELIKNNVGLISGIPKISSNEICIKDFKSLFFPLPHWPYRPIITLDWREFLFLIKQFKEMSLQ